MDNIIETILLYSFLHYFIVFVSNQDEMMALLERYTGRNHLLIKGLYSAVLSSILFTIEGKVEGSFSNLTLLPVSLSLYLPSMKVINNNAPTWLIL